jgi:hypothetical protein
MPTVTKKDLNNAGCGVPNCKHDHSILYLHSSCHIKSPVFIRYEKKDEILVITCGECNKEVVKVKL